MEVKDVVTLVIAVAMAAVIGFLMISVMENFVGTGGTFENYLKQIFDIIINKALTTVSPE